MKHNPLYVAMLLMGLAILNACSGKKEKTEKIVHSVMTVHPLNSAGAQSKNFSGVVKENASISLGFRAAGQIQRILVKEGQRVKKGQLLAQLDTKDYQLAVDNARVMEKQARDQVERLKPLYEGNAVNAEQYEQATSRLESLQIQLRNAENQLAYTRLTSPADGFVQTVNHEVGEIVGMGSSIVELVDDHRREVEINVPHDVARDYNRYESAYCLYNGNQYPLEIISVLHKADANQLYTVRLAINAPLHPGQSVDVHINLSGEDNAALTLPANAIFEDNGQSCVWVVNKGKVNRRKVSIGEMDRSGRVVITEGICAEDEVVKAGVNYLHEGEEVRIVTNESTNVGDLL